VVIDAAASKVRRRRVVQLMPSAMDWVAKSREVRARLPIPFSTRRRIIRRARECLGLSAWPQDILRHTCASYWVAHSQDLGKISMQLGNSPAILLRHYRELVTREEADRFWGLRP